MRAIFVSGSLVRLALAETVLFQSRKSLTANDLPSWENRTLDSRYQRSLIVYFNPKVAVSQICTSTGFRISILGFEAKSSLLAAASNLPSGDKATELT